MFIKVFNSKNVPKYFLTVNLRTKLKFRIENFIVCPYIIIK